MRILTSLIIVSLVTMLEAGCGPTYPKEIVDEAVIQLCKEEYGVDVKVKLSGTTIAVYLPIEELLDKNFRLSEEASDKINNVILSVSRVTLSTDAPIKFYIVIAQDPEFPELEVVIIRYVDDIKMYHYTQISRDDFADRALIELKLTPQAEKEKILKAVLEQFGAEEGVEEIMKEYLDEEVNTIGDIGYWNGQFYTKEINLEEFLALQIASRSRRKFERDEKLLEGKFRINFIRGSFSDNFGTRTFEFDLNAEPIGPEVLGEEREIIFKPLFDIVASILCGYKFKDYDNVSILSSSSGEELVATRSEVEDYESGKLKFGDFLWIN